MLEIFKAAIKILITINVIMTLYLLWSVADKSSDFWQTVCKEYDSEEQK